MFRKRAFGKCLQQAARGWLEQLYTREGGSVMEVVTEKLEI